MRRRLVVLSLVAGLLAFAAMGSGAGASGPTPLDIALTLAPPPAGSQTYTFDFADNRAIGPRGYKLASFYTAMENRLWRPTDVEWASQAGTDGPNTVTATALGAGVDLAPIAAKLTSCGYRKRTINGVDVYSATTNMLLACVGDFGDAVPFETEIGIDATRHIILGAKSPTAITGAIRGTNDLHKDAAISGALAQVAGAPAVTVASGPDFCRLMTRSLTGRNSGPQIVAAARRADPAGRPFTTFAFGTRFAGSRATARMVLAYADAATARKDVGVRARVLRQGESFATQVRYSGLLKLNRAVAKGRNILLDVSAPARRPLGLHDMFERYDLAFARC